MIEKYRKYLIFFLIIFFFKNYSLAKEISNIEIIGNNRISNETIIVFSDYKNNIEINERNINNILKNLYDTNFFKDVSLKIDNDKLIITVVEEALIQTLSIEGLASNTLEDLIKKNLNLKNRSSFNDYLFNEDLRTIKNILKAQGYFFSKVFATVEDLDDNKINIVYNITLGNKSKIKKITFTGNKIFKDRKLRSVIVSEEYKFWKFISGKKYLNEEMIKFDENLLNNFFKNEGYYNVKINSSFAKLIKNNEFELIYNIDAGKKYFFGDLKLEMSLDYNQENFISINKFLKKLQGEHYSINSIDRIVKKIDEVIIQEQFESVKAVVTEKIIDDKINMIFLVDESERFLVERINIFGNNITEERVLRNQLQVDEGDIYNEILVSKSINNIKALNFFKNVNSEIVSNKNNTNKIINISVEEKATGEIMAGAGVGTSGSTVLFGIKENNYLGKGIGLNSQLQLSEEDIKGTFSVNNPNFKNSDKSLFFSLESSETDRLKTSGYKNNKTGFTVGTRFEYFDDLDLFVGTSNYYEKISTNSTASAKQQKQKGNYWDSILNLNFTQDKRNARFQTSSGYISRYSLDVPVISDTNTFKNTYSYKIYDELYDNNVTSVGFSIGSAFSIDDSDIKLSERLFIPSKNLRGFESGKVGPKDGKDFIGGNYMTTLNFSSTLPQILPNSENLDAVLFIDAANLWGVDYDSSLDDGGELRSSIGIALDMFTVVGPMSLSLAQPLSKGSNDKTESFRFNIGTTF
ncbi:outer membrane protein assembly factor BamA [Candidatus Pelagibacter sp. HIMB1746]|uniref:outer membrane protein assembly factor BamA n=1 Tax=Candidatus Pelagibacter sp. HIMB1746 TaxID=3413370 RepID=UPI003F82A23E